MGDGGDNARDARLAALGRAASELVHALRGHLSVIRNSLWLVPRPLPFLKRYAALIPVIPATRK
jgi:hypothetical protein